MCDALPKEFFSSIKFIPPPNKAHANATHDIIINEILCPLPIMLAIFRKNFANVKLNYHKINIFTGARPPEDFFVFAARRFSRSV